MKKSRYKELADQWFKRAGDDLLWAKFSLKNKFFGGACFLSQQIAEKTLKAYLFSQEKKLLKTHNLIQLLKFAKDCDSEFNQMFENCKILNSYYTDTRYPDIWDYDRFNNQKLAQEAIHSAEELLKFTQNKLCK